MRGEADKQGSMWVAASEGCCAACRPAATTSHTHTCAIAPPPPGRYAQLPGTVAGFIFDSAPVYPHPGAKQRVLAASEPPGLRRTLLSAFLRAADAVESVAGRRGDHRAGAFWANMQRLSWARPLMYLYSADDPLADGAAITALVEDKRRRGHDVRARCWERSAHVAHLRHHREEYTRLLLGFLQDVRLPGGGGGGGGTHVRAAAAIAAPPRSRL